MSKQPSEITRLLLEWSEGDPGALAELMPLVCDDLRAMARRQMVGESPGHTLQPTALVNEFYLRLNGRRSVSWKNSAHFFGFAAQAMRRILVDHARKKKRDKRGGDVQKVPLELAGDLPDPGDVDLVELDQALDRLAEMDPRQAQIVELRFFIGLTVAETAAVLEISDPTVKREWSSARLWLLREMGGPKKK